MRETTNYGLKITEGNDNWKNIFDDNADNMDTIDEALAAKLETVPDMGGATALTPGTAGLAPAPSAGETNRFLRADGTWTVPAGSGDSEVGIYTIDATIPVSSWQGSGPYTVTISDSSIISTMQVLEWSIVNETEATPLMLGPTEPTISAGRLTISTTVKPVASWTVHFDLGTDGSNVLAEVAGKAGQELLGYKEEGNTASRTIASGKFVVWKGNLYKAKAAIPQGTAFSTSNLTAVGDGGFNELQTKIGAVGNTDLQSQVTSLNSKTDEIANRFYVQVMTLEELNNYLSNDTNRRRSTIWMGTTVANALIGSSANSVAIVVKADDSVADMLVFSLGAEKIAIVRYNFSTSTVTKVKTATLS